METLETSYLAHLYVSFIEALGVYQNNFLKGHAAIFKVFDEIPLDWLDNSTGELASRLRECHRVCSSTDDFGKTPYAVRKVLDVIQGEINTHLDLTWP